MLTFPDADGKTKNQLLRLLRTRLEKLEDRFRGQISLPRSAQPLECSRLMDQIAYLRESLAEIGATPTEIETGRPDAGDRKEARKMGIKPKRHQPAIPEVVPEGALETPYGYALVDSDGSLYIRRVRYPYGLTAWCLENRHKLLKPFPCELSAQPKMIYTGPLIENPDNPAQTGDQTPCEGQSVN